MSSWSWHDGVATLTAGPPLVPLAISYGLLAVEPPLKHSDRAGN